MYRWAVAASTSHIGEGSEQQYGSQGSAYCYSNKYFVFYTSTGVMN